MDLDELYRVLRGAHVQAQGVVDTIDAPLLVLDGDLEVISANPAFYREFQTTRDETLCKPFFQLANGEWDLPELRLLMERVIPKSLSVVNYEVQADFPKIGERTMLISAQRMAHPDNGRHLLLLTIVDATEIRAKDQARDLLLGEVRHRLKNLLAVTQALARQTKAKGVSGEEYRDAFLGRFANLARAIEASVEGKPTNLPDLVAAVMQPYIQVQGPIELCALPAVRLGERIALSLSMVLHELATNALKHGALSVPAGKVRIDGHVEGDGAVGRTLALAWVETGGPRAEPPDVTGFGSHLIRSSIERDLIGEVAVDYTPQGLTVSLSFPLD